MAEKPVAALKPGAFGLHPELTDSDFFRFCQLVHQHAGIHLTAQKKELVRARLMKILRQRGLKSFQEYHERVMNDTTGVELTCLLDAISTNQTAFWREPKHFQFIAAEVLPAWPAERCRPLRGNIWSAGCSSGEEPYTLAIIMMATFPGEDLSQVRIFASDLNTQVLAQAEQGIYPVSRVEPLPADWRRRFFQMGVKER
ncbi:MAG: CheR family methyltransferase, partial [Desulfobaccales bacterium]